jgi:hypothetical protein
VNDVDGFVIPQQRWIGPADAERLYEAEHRLTISIEKAAEEWTRLVVEKEFYREVPDLYKQAIPQVVLDRMLSYDSRAGAAVVLGWLRSSDAQNVEGLRDALLETIDQFLLGRKEDHE